MLFVRKMVFVAQPAGTLFVRALLPMTLPVQTVWKVLLVVVVVETAPTPFACTTLSVMVGTVAQQP